MDIESMPSYIATWSRLLQFHICTDQHIKKYEENQKHVLSCNQFNLNKKGNTLSWSKRTEAILQNPLKIPPSIKLKVSIVHCAEICINPFNVCRPIVVTAFNCISETFFILHVYFPESDSLTQLCSFCWKETVHLNEMFVHLLDGPSIVLHFQKSLLTGFWDPLSKKFVTKQFSGTFTSPRSIKHALKANERQILLLTVCNVNSDGASIHDDSMTDLFEESAERTGYDWLLLRVSIDRMEVVDGVFSIPCSYADVTVKMLVLESDGMGSFGSCLILATRLSQLVLIKNDNRRCLCDLPFSDVKVLFAATVGDSEKVILVGSESNGVCMVDLKSFEVKNHWLSAVSVFCEDFLQLGWNQILLISEQLSVDKEKQNRFILTDLIHTWPSTEGAGDETTDSRESDACHSYLMNALHAVEVKLQNTSTLLQNLQLQSSRKNSVIQQNKKALQAISEQTGILPQKEPSLMCIINPNNKEEVTKNLDFGQKNSILVKTNSFWQRIVGQKWIIGIMVENNGMRPVSDICLLLVHCNSPVRNQTSTSHVLNPSDTMNPYTHDKTEGSLYLAGGHQMCVTCVLQLPLFDDTPTVTFDLALIWKEWIVNGHDQIQESIERRSCVHKSSLSFKDIDEFTINATLDKIFEGMLTKVDFLALDTVQECTRLSISSQHTALLGLSHLLCSEMGFTEVKMNEIEGLFCDKGQLSGMRIFCKNVNATSVKMDVHSWGKYQLVIFCRILYNILPYDASVKAVDSGNDFKDEAGSNLIVHLQSELDMMKEAMTSNPLKKDVKPDSSASKGLRLKDFVNLREATDKAMSKFSSISGT